MLYGYDEGDECKRNRCKGIIANRPVENCYCHICAPCSSCVDSGTHCPVCGWRSIDDVIMNDHIVNVHPVTQIMKFWEPRKLDSSKIDFHSRSHTHSSMMKEGVYPTGATRDQVEEKVKGTFGGRFDSFGGGRFCYIAYTD